MARIRAFAPPIDANWIDCTVHGSARVMLFVLPGYQAEAGCDYQVWKGWG